MHAYEAFSVEGIFSCYDCSSCQCAGNSHCFSGAGGNRCCGHPLGAGCFFFAADTTGTQTFQQVLEQAFNLAIGIEFIKMLAKHTPGSAIEVLVFAMARQLVIGHMTPVENLLGVIAIGIIFIIRKFLFVPSFGAHLPANAPGAKNIPSDTIEYGGFKRRFALVNLRFFVDFAGNLSYFFQIYGHFYEFCVS